MWRSTPATDPSCVASSAESDRLNQRPLTAQQHLPRAFAQRRSGSLESIACRWPVSAGFLLGTILRQFGDLSKTENGSCWPTSADLCDAAPASAPGHSATENDVRDEGGFSRNLSPGAGDGCGPTTILASATGHKRASSARPSSETPSTLEKTAVTKASP